MYFAMASDGPSTRTKSAQFEMKQPFAMMAQRGMLQVRCRLRKALGCLVHFVSLQALPTRSLR